MNAALYLLPTAPRQETPVTARNGCPYRPGDLTAAPGPNWGHARVADANGHGSTLVSSSQATADAHARMAADYPRLVAELARVTAERHRLADAMGKALETVGKTHPAFRTAEMKQVAALLRDALRGPAALADVTDAEIAAALGRIEAAADDAHLDGLIREFNRVAVPTPDRADRAREGGGM